MYFGGGGENCNRVNSQNEAKHTKYATDVLCNTTSFQEDKIKYPPPFVQGFFSVQWDQFSKFTILKLDSSNLLKIF